MTWLVPIGLLGLLGIIALIVIYIIKPNYQQKFISSTYVWKLSLKYRKKQLPLSKLNNILLFLCQLLIMTICGLLLAQPVLASERQGDKNEKIIIIDASANMQLSIGNETRLDRAVEGARLLIEQTLEDGGLVSVILADETPEFLVQRAGEANIDELYEALDMLVMSGTAVSYSSADLDAAAALAEEVLSYNNEAQVYLYTGTKYIQKNGIEVVDVSDLNVEWNAAVLNCTAKMNDNNHYEISVDLGCYNRTELLTVRCDVHGANGKGQTVTLSKSEFFDPSSEEKTVTFTTDDFGGSPLYSFDHIEVYVEVADSFLEDNDYTVYGGKEQVIRIQYASSDPNFYFGGVIRTLREYMKESWDIEFTELKSNEQAATEGFDFYIFEHRMPEVMPTDGVVLLVDPDVAPENSGLRFEGIVPVSSDSVLASGASSPLMSYVDPSRITIAKYTEISLNDGYEELAYYQGNPIILAKNEPGAKIVVWAFDLTYSNIIALPDYSFLIYNMFNTYIPTTIDSHSFEIGDTVTLNARGTELTVTADNGETVAFEQSQGSLVVNRPGSYTVTQKPMQGDELIIDSFFVRIPNYESNITKQVDELPPVYAEWQVELEYQDLLFYFAIALVALLFVEWYLQSKKSI